MYRAALSNYPATGLSYSTAGITSKLGFSPLMFPQIAYASYSHPQMHTSGYYPVATGSHSTLPLYQAFGQQNQIHSTPITSYASAAPSIYSQFATKVTKFHINIIFSCFIKEINFISIFVFKKNVVCCTKSIILCSI